MNSKIRSPHYIIELAREMRINLTLAEKLLWNELWNKNVNGYKFRCQHPIYRYILDFFCSNKRLAIEIDGDIHKIRIEYDEYRDKFLESLGIRTLRFSNSDVIQNLNIVLQRIEDKLQEKINN